MCPTTFSSGLVCAQTRYLILRPLDGVRQYLTLGLPGFPHGKKDKIDAVVMVNFLPYFVANPVEADVKIMAEHI